ncbi:LamG domain-containing protein [Streptacidiphilus sp. MAP5-3]|uniref:LamG domain-containing protein n=1 Tax=unclassified Streptacidiphilus TaxID=2643834 RepID=UPI003512AE89
MTFGDPIRGEGSGPEQAGWPAMPGQQSGQQLPPGAQPPQGGQTPPDRGPAMPNSGYGYPPQQQFPQQQFPQQGAPQQPYPPAGSQEPDWNALAEQNESRSRNRRRWRTTALVVGAVVLVGGACAGAFLTLGKHNTPTPVATGSPSASPSATAHQQQLSDAEGTVPLAVGSAATLAPVAPEAGGQPGNGTQALAFNSRPESYAGSTGPVVDTQNSFTVAGWVMNSAKQDGRTAISQGDDGYYAFDLGRDFWTKHNKWVFKVQTAAGNQDKTVYAVYSKADATQNAWVFLSGTYDATAHTISLYVNGQLQGTTKVPGIWSDTGTLQLGRLRYQGSWVDHWNGQITDVECWNTALTAPQVAGAMKGTATAAPDHAWLVH